MYIEKRSINLVICQLRVTINQDKLTYFCQVGNPIKNFQWLEYNDDCKDLSYNNNQGGEGGAQTSKFFRASREYVTFPPGQKDSYTPDSNIKK